MCQLAGTVQGKRETEPSSPYGRPAGDSQQAAFVSRLRSGTGHFFTRVDGRRCG